MVIRAWGLLKQVHVYSVCVEDSLPRQVLTGALRVHLDHTMRGQGSLAASSVKGGHLPGISRPVDAVPARSEAFPTPLGPLCVLSACQERHRLRPSFPLDAGGASRGLIPPMLGLQCAFFALQGPIPPCLEHPG
jgi:hypothetical protein